MESQGKLSWKESVKESLDVSLIQSPEQSAEIPEGISAGNLGGIPIKIPEGSKLYIRSTFNMDLLQ